MGKGGGSCGSKADDAIADQPHGPNAPMAITPQPAPQTHPRATAPGELDTVTPLAHHRVIESESPPSAIATAASPLSMASTSKIDLASLHSRTRTNTNTEELVAYLIRVPLLSKLTRDDRALLASALKEEHFSATTTIVTEGDDGSVFYIIREGEARVTKTGVNGSASELCVLKASDYFGEQALVHNSKRMATVTALTPITLLSMDRDKFQSLFGSDKLAVNFVKRAAVSAEPLRNDDDHTDTSTHSLSSKTRSLNRHKTEAQRTMLLSAVQRNILFDRLSQAQRSEVVDLMWLESVASQSTIIKQGDIGSHFYVVESGGFDIFVRQKPSQSPTHTHAHTNNGSSATVVPVPIEEVKVASRGYAESFGELALLYNAPRAATVIARQDSSVWVLSRIDFRRLVERGNRERLAEYEAFLKRVTSFEALLDYERAKIAEALEEVSYPNNAVIVKQNEPGDTFFILARGEVRCTIKNDSDDVELEVARYHSGDYFGERALIAGEKRAATVTAVGPVTCLYLNREAFSLLLGPMEEIFKRRVDGYIQTPRMGNSPMVAPQSTQRTPLAPIKDDHTMQTSSPQPVHRSSIVKPAPLPVHSPPTMPPLKFQLGEFKIIGTLGKGSFGHVQLVRHYLSNTVYALKTVSKMSVVRLGQQQHMIDERKAMITLNSPHLIRLFATFQDWNAIYLVLEPSLGGELFSVLRARTLFDEPTARFYAAAVVCAFEYMHSKGYIYRDLKPENLLLDTRGYLKITDFGFAKHVGDGRTWTLCGTPDYLAPEVVSGAGHGKGVDWWTLGILVFEMLASYPPFYDEDPMRTYAKIMRGDFHCPSHLSKPAFDFIRRLLHPKATKRLGVVAGGARTVMEHSFFAGFDWDAFHSGAMKAPIVPRIKNMEDLSNFEKYPDDTKMEPYVADATQPDWTESF